MAHDADLALDALRPPAARGCAYRALGCAVIHSVLRGHTPRDAASWLRGPDGRFWAAVGGLDAEALADRLAPRRANRASELSARASESSDDSVVTRVSVLVTGVPVADS